MNQLISTKAPQERYISLCENYISLVRSFSITMIFSFYQYIAPPELFARNTMH